MGFILELGKKKYIYMPALTSAVTATDNMMSRVVNDRTFYCTYCAVGLLRVATEKKK